MNEQFQKTKAETDIAPPTAELVQNEADRIQLEKERAKAAEQLRWQAKREDAAALRKARIAIMGESEFLQSKWAVEIPEETMESARMDIRTELSKRAGVLGKGEAASTSEQTEGQVISSPRSSETSFFGVQEEEAEDRSEPTTAGISLAELQRQDSRVFGRAPVSDRTRAAVRAPEQVGQSDVSADLDQAFSKIIRPPTIRPPAPPEQRV